MDQPPRRSQSNRSPRPVTERAGGSVRSTAHRNTARDRTAVGAVALCGLFLGGCANLSFTRDSPTSGEFRSTGFSFTILSWDLPKGARLIAQENASDANLPNTVVERDTVFPYLGPLDWLLDIVGVRYAVIEGSWGFEQGGSQGPGSVPTGGFGG